jgi:MFS family permease
MASDAVLGGTIYRAAFKDPVARRLLTAQTASDVGDYAGTAALILLTYHETGNVLGPAVVFAASTVPALLLGTVFGRWLDRPARKPALIALCLIGAATTAGVALLPRFGTAVTAAFLLGAARTAYVGIAVGTVADSVAPDAQASFFTATTTIFDLGQLVGLVGGASVTLAVGASSALGFDSITFLLAAASLTRLPGGPAPTRDGDHARATGLRSIRSVPVLWILTPVVCAAMAGTALPETLAPKLAAGAALPFLMAGFPAGSVLATVVLNRTAVLDRVGSQLGWAVAMGLGFGLAAAFWASGLGAWAVAAANGLIGAASIWIIGARTTFVRHTPAAVMAQVEATMVAMATASQGFGTLALSGIASSVGPAAAYGTEAALLLLVGSTALLRSRTLPA